MLGFDDSNREVRRCKGRASKDRALILACALAKRPTRNPLRWETL